MTESIDQKLVSTIGTIVPVFLDEAEADKYPFATYEMTVTPQYDKDGIYKYVADVKLYVVSNVFSEVDSISDSVISAIKQGMNDGQYVAKETPRMSNCYEGIWAKEIDYTIIQNY